MKERLQYTDYIARLYPEFTEGKPSHGVGRVISRSFTFQVTDACNLACTYCYQTHKGTRRMSFETAKLAVDNLLTGANGFGDYVSLENSPAIVLEFIGGEPFLEIELIDQIVDYFRETAIEMKHPWADNFMISICSNGVLYNDPRVFKFLRKNRDVLSFSVTVDGTQELHDSCRMFPDGSPSYYLAHAAAMDWMHRGYYMGSKVTIAPGNLKYLSDSLLQMIEDGYSEIHANCVYENVWEPEHATELYWQCKRFTDKFLTKYDADDLFLSLLDDKYAQPMSIEDNNNWCGGDASMLAIDPDGNIYPCLRYMESSLGTDRAPLVIGNVNTGLALKQEEKDCIHCMQCITRRSQSTDKCFYCPVASGCSWCSAYNYQMTGSVDKRVTYICEMHKARCLAMVYYWNTYHKKVQDDKVMDLWLPEKYAVPIVGQEEYDMLKNLTTELGGYVNSNKVRISKEDLEDGSINKI